ncbi:MAG: 5-formyltetrahydrofolate cyclo-ligase [Xanthomonadales bacterium]|nr:5-formyltetrahydrofolate cyclo-ligase [Gammaproteobacteria bacterium]MBT8052662.1 5-formyltetrahydrofolate cyclo-ligase [Gammaproteobacteria bacterium]NND56579.1 5-formyltetrahydrofolate cyclo-ligase [Xanthomonadales bacterium]NNK52479.1 5-formyltetrahydrofolate cyclo-ligase [Xanthomonadales bacterium]
MHSEASQKSQKIQLRKDIRRKRAIIDEKKRAHWDALINHQLLAYVSQARPATVAAYMAFDGEPDLAPTLTALYENGAKLALPVVRDAPGKSVITFSQWKPDSDLRPNRYGIAEPAGTDLVRIIDIDLVLVPLVGWDKSGGRLGMGASFYDRLFQPFAELDKPVRMGVGYALQQVSRIPREPWDIRLHGMLTENGWFTCGG